MATRQILLELDEDDWNTIQNELASQGSHMDRDDIERRIDSLAKKRDYAADVLGKPLLALTYQMEIEAILAGKPNGLAPPVHDVFVKPDVHLKGIKHGRQGH